MSTNWKSLSGEIKNIPFPLVEKFNWRTLRYFKSTK